MTIEIINGISLIALHGRKQEKQVTRECLAVDSRYDAHLRLADAGLIEILHSARPQDLDRIVKKRGDLTFEESFQGMCFALAATNRYFRELCWTGTDTGGWEQALCTGTAFMQLMSAKEALWRLTPAEIAGMTAATLADTVCNFHAPCVIETCGMGGDRGFEKDKTFMKTINASTLSAIVLASLGLPAIKHGSYANTSAVGSTDAIERFGARTSLASLKDAYAIWETSGFCYFDAHICRTVHDLSHLLMMETVNHVVGPMSVPVTPTTQIRKMMGVNEKVHPASVAKAYTLLHRRGIQNVGAVLVVGGLGEKEETDIAVPDEEAFREQCILDEVSPYATVCSWAYGDRFVDSFLIRPEDFGISIDPDAIVVPNIPDVIQKANVAALRGEHEHLTRYLAMNAALGMFAAQYADDVRSYDYDIRCIRIDLLRFCYRMCHDAIASGRAWQQLVRYVTMTGGTLSLP